MEPKAKIILPENPDGIDWLMNKTRVIVIVSLTENLGFVGSWRDANQFFIIIDSWDGTEEIEKNESIKFKTKKSIILSYVDFDICLFGNVQYYTQYTYTD